MLKRAGKSHKKMATRPFRLSLPPLSEMQHPLDPRYRDSNEDNE